MRAFEQIRIRENELFTWVKVTLSEISCAISSFIGSGRPLFSNLRALTLIFPKPPTVFLVQLFQCLLGLLSKVLLGLNFKAEALCCIPSHQWRLLFIVVFRSLTDLWLYCSYLFPELHGTCKVRGLRTEQMALSLHLHIPLQMMWTLWFRNICSTEW